MGITFKREQYDNRWIGQPSVEIKLDKRVIGTISAPKTFSKREYWQIGYTVIKADLMEDGNPNCNWKWIFESEKINSEELARQYVKDNWQKIAEKYQFHYMD